jgi:hypothetical protein
MATRRVQAPDKARARAELAWRALLAQTHGFRVRAVGPGPSGRGGQRELASGVIVASRNDHPGRPAEEGGSNIVVIFDSGVRLPLEQISELTRAGD